MCDLLYSSTKEKIKGYKIVAKKLKGKRYYSIAMGFKYPLDGHVPVARKQRLIYLDFTNNIISKTSLSYKENMVGRTAIFRNLTEALERYFFWVCCVKEGYKLAIVRSEVSIDVMEGNYGSREVAAGRHIRFIKELNHPRLDSEVI